jgi:dihydroorotate dehydrogenase electron transfer subunit
MKDQVATVVENTFIQKHYFLLKIQADYISQKAKPGNFVMIRVSSTLEPLLKRPFGIFDAVPPHIWIYFEVVGKGTRLLSELTGGDKITILGPLGNSFPSLNKRNILGIAGGRGIAPIHFALKEYSKNNQVNLVYGARSRQDLNLLKNLENLNLGALFLYTDDGSMGKKGLATSDIKNIIHQKKPNIGISCGPNQMLKAIYDLTHNTGIRNYVSMEALMGCGFGICHSCVILTRSYGYKKVCSDGPVFDIEEIEW